MIGNVSEGVDSNHQPAPVLETERLYQLSYPPCAWLEVGEGGVEPPTASFMRRRARPLSFSPSCVLIGGGGIEPPTVSLED